jgi:hypothetical protein
LKRKDRGLEETLEQHGLVGGKVRSVSDIVNDVLDEHGISRVKRKKALDLIRDEEEEE